MSADSPENGQEEKLAIERFLAAAALFRRWATDRYPHAAPDDCGAVRETLGGEWELEFDDWGALHEASIRLLAAVPPEDWTPSLEEQFFYILARDNEDEWLKAEVSKHPRLLERLVRAVGGRGDCDARWQLVVAVGSSEMPRELKLELILPFARDAHEYVRRRCLSELATLNAPQTEEFALLAWNYEGVERPWSRMAALHALAQVRSPHFGRLKTEAMSDADPHLREYATKIKDAAGQG